MHALRRLGRKVVGGRPQCCARPSAFRQSGPSLVGKRIVIDPGHGGADPGVVVPDGPLRWTEADLAYDLADPAGGPAGRRRHAGAPDPRPAAGAAADRPGPGARWPTSLGADLLISLHLDGHANPAADGVAPTTTAPSNGVTSTSASGWPAWCSARSWCAPGCATASTHAKTWELLRLTRMPAVRVEVGYLTSPADRARLIDPLFRERVVEAIVAAVQRMYFPVETDVPTGSIDVRSCARRWPRG